MEDYLTWGQFIFVLVICMLTLLYLKFWYSRRRLHEFCDKLPGMDTNTLTYYLLGMKHVYFVRRDVTAATMLLQVVYGLGHLFIREKIFCFWIPFRPIIHFFKPENVEVLLSSHTSIGKAQEYRFLHPWLGAGLLTSTGDKWRSRRKLLTPAFHFQILQDFMPILNEQSMILANKLLEQSKEQHVDIVPLMTLCTLDIICETAMGLKLDIQNGGCPDYVRAVHEVGDTVFYRLLRPWFWLNQIFYCFPVGWKFLKNLQLVHGFTRKVIKEKKAILVDRKRDCSSIQDTDTCKAPKRKVFLELLLEHHIQDESSLTEEDIREEVDTFMFEGHDTTASALSFALYNIGLLPEVQENLINEMDSIFGEDSLRPVTTEDLRLMKYTECVIKESLRLYPPVPFFAREIDEDIQVSEYTIVPGSVCVVFPVLLHRNPEIFPNPEKFDPERFFPENAVGRHPYAYVPFSAGPRNCIGQKFALMEEKTVLANIFRRMRVRSLDPRDRVHLTSDLILRSAGPLRLEVTPRSRDKTAS